MLRRYRLEKVQFLDVRRTFKISGDSKKPAERALPPACIIFGDREMAKILDNLKRFYVENGISASRFACEHQDDCRTVCSEFTEAREALVGCEYENGVVPRLLFISLDPPFGEDDATKRTVEAMVKWEEGCDHSKLPKSRHWYRTHELALTLLKSFKPDLRLEHTCKYFAHTNSAKCSTNQEGGRSANWKLFENCREYLRGEIEALKPDIIVTQGDAARIAIEHHFVGCDIKRSDLPRCHHGILNSGGRSVLWVHTHHPRHFGEFNRERRECWDHWAAVTRSFIERPRVG
jgi:hypothetical protein